MRYLVFIILFFIGLNSVSFAQKNTLNWVQESKEAAWQARDSQGEFVFKGNMWILGGWFTPQLPNPRDVWKSPDGKNWTRVLETAPWQHSDLPAAMVFKNRMWIMGGRKLPGTNTSNQVWSSKDGAGWVLETPNAGWSPRLAPGFVVFKDRMWIMGGTSDFYKNNDTTLFNDVWSSANGKDWKLELANAPWSKRTHGQAIVFDGKIWIIGGGTRAPKANSLNDVWCSEDGVNWTQVTAAAPWDPRIWFSALVYRDRMWVLGGWADSGNKGDVWYSKDGKNWTELKSDVKWSTRHEQAAFVFKDKIWIAGGAAEPNYLLDSEVWSLKVPRGWFGEN